MKFCQANFVRSLLGVFLLISVWQNAIPANLFGKWKTEEKEGILVMAHGGDSDWNSAVKSSVEPLQTFCPVEIAYGMAERSSLQEAVTQLESLGVNRIAVVRLFVSPESFVQQTEYLLGLRNDAPKNFVMPGMDHSGSSGTETANMEIPMPISTKAKFILSKEGLYDSPLMGKIMAERIRNTSVYPDRESIMILAHGAEDDDENARWIAKISSCVGKEIDFKGFRSVKVETLREDWPEKKALAEKSIRDYVVEGSTEGGRVIVVPFRLFGFGPYKDVLKDLNYVPCEQGLLPHPYITQWIKFQATDCFVRAGWKNPFVNIRY